MKPLQEMYHMSSCQATLSTFTVSHISWTVCCACTLCTLEDVIYFEFLVGVTHAPVLSSSTTTLAIFAHSLIPWPPHSGLFHRFRTHHRISVGGGRAFSTLQLKIGTFLSFVRLTDLRENPSACSWEALVSVGWPPKSPSTAGEFWIS